MGLDYVDIFYSHRFDPVTPLEETIGALDTLVRQGKALYVGISSYSAERTAEAAAIARSSGLRSSSISPPIRSSTAGSRTVSPACWSRRASARSRSRRSRRAS